MLRPPFLRSPSKFNPFASDFLPPWRRWKERFASFRPVVIDLDTGEVAPDIDPETFDQQKAKKDPARSEEAPPNQGFQLESSTNMRLKPGVRAISLRTAEDADVHLFRMRLNQRFRKKAAEDANGSPEK